MAAGGFQKEGFDLRPLLLTVATIGRTRLQKWNGEDVTYLPLGFTVWGYLWAPALKKPRSIQTRTGFPTQAV